MTEPKGRRPEKRKKRMPRKATAKHLENAALYYLQRFATSAENLKRVLMRKVLRSAHFHGTDADEGEARVKDLIKRYRASGLLDDTVFARARAASLHRRGNSARQIRGKLRQKGVADEDIETALAALQQEAGTGPSPDREKQQEAGDGGKAGGAEDIELAAALIYAKRRRFGRFAGKKPPPEQRQKQLAALARAGFSYDIARQVLNNDEAN